MYLIWSSVLLILCSASALEKQRMAFKLQKFGVDPENLLIKINKEVSVVSNCCFVQCSCSHKCLCSSCASVEPGPNCFIYTLYGVLHRSSSLQIYAEFDSAENPLPVLGEACPLRCVGEQLWLCCPDTK
jgi:hypothetical protein